MVEQASPLAAQRSNGSRFEWRISLGNVLTIIGGMAIGAMMLVQVTRSFDALDKQVAVLAIQVTALQSDLSDVRRWVRDKDKSSP